MRRGLGLLLGMVLLGSVAAGAAEYWEKKKYAQWTAKECQKLLDDSPWAKKYVLSETRITPLGESPVAAAPPSDPTAMSAPPGASDTNVGLTARQPNTRLVYHVQLRSALPIRQALVRRAQLRQNYDTMMPEQKQAFDQEAAKFLNAEFPETVLVYVTFESNVDFDNRELRRYWKLQTTSTLKNFVYLVGSEGAKAPLQHFIMGEEDAQAFRFVFSRQVEGKPRVTAQDKRLQLEFIHPNLRAQGEKRVLVEFKLNKMLVDGQLTY